MSNGVANKLNIYGVIGSTWNGITAKQVVDQLKNFAESDDKDVALHINSGGGYVDDAVAIFNRLRSYAKEHDATITAHIDGLAASAATLVMLSASHIAMPANASMMVHSPWGLAIGTAEDMRKGADLLDMTESSMVGMYTARTGMDAADVRDLLSAETWMNAEDADAFGFVDEIEVDDEEDEVEALARIAIATYQAQAREDSKLSTYASVPDWAQHREQRPAQVRAAASAEPPADDAPQSHTPEPVDGSNTENNPMADAPKNTVDLEAVKAEARKAEAKRITGIQSACRAHNVSDEFEAELVDSDKTVIEAKAALIDWLAENKPSAKTGSGIEVVVDEADNRMQAARAAIEARVGLATAEESRNARQSRYGSMSLSEMAIAFAGSADPGIGGKKERVGAILASANRTGDYYGAQGRPAADIGITHTVSDFTNLLANVATKSMMKGWDNSPSTFEPWTNRGTLPNFLQATRVGMNLFPNLLEVEEGAEYQGATMGDRGENIQLATFGRTFGISRQAIINDDLMGIMRAPRAMGAAARRTINNAVYAILTTNANLSDGNPLFDAAHSNTSSIDWNAAGLSTLKAAMRTQTGPDTGEELNITPRFVVVPAGLEHDVNVLLNASFVSDGTNTVSNVVQGYQAIIEPRLDADSATTGYLMADGSQFDTIEVAYLDGNDMPRIEQMAGWRVDGAEFKVGIDFGVAVIDYRGMQRGT